jgi:group I intron endonuclease
MEEQSYTVNYIIENKIDKKTYGFIYITTNLVNGKKYIGQRKFSYGWKTYLGSGVHFIYAKKNYGNDNFKRDICAFANNQDDLNKLEKQWIEDFKAVKSKEFYNLTEGGKSCNTLQGKTKEEIKIIKDKWRKSYIGKYQGINSFNYGKKLSEETKQKIKKNHVNVSKENNPNYGKAMSENQKQKLSQEIKGKYIGGKNPFFNKTHSIQTRQKISENNKGRKLSQEQINKLINIAKKGKENHSARQIICVTTNEVFDTMKDAFNKYKIDISAITKNCRGKYNYAGTLNGVQLQWMYYEDFLKGILPTDCKTTSSIKIICITTNQIFKSGIEASEWCGVNLTNISKCCKGKSKSSGKHPETGEPLKWMYYEDYIAQQKQNNEINT